MLTAPVSLLTAELVYAVEFHCCGEYFPECNAPLGNYALQASSSSHSLYKKKKTLLCCCAREYNEKYYTQGSGLSVGLPTLSKHLVLIETHTVGGFVGLEEIRQQAFLGGCTSSQCFPVQNEQETVKLHQDLVQHWKHRQTESQTCKNDKCQTQIHFKRTLYKTPALGQGFLKKSTRGWQKHLRKFQAEVLGILYEDLCPRQRVQLRDMSFIIAFSC